MDSYISTPSITMVPGSVIDIHRLKPNPNPNDSTMDIDSQPPLNPSECIFQGAYYNPQDKSARCALVGQVCVAAIPQLHLENRQSQGQLAKSEWIDAYLHQDAADKKIKVECARSVVSKVATTPDVGAKIIGRVIRVNPRFATLEILCVDLRPILDGFRGMIRLQDIRSTELDSVSVYKSFMPGDIVEALVIGIGDRNAFYLSTARNDLGVIFAKSSASNTPMIPISWTEMQCAETGEREFRKVAKSKLWSQQ